MLYVYLSMFLKHPEKFYAKFNGIIEYGTSTFHLPASVLFELFFKGKYWLYNKQPNKYYFQKEKNWCSV